MRVLFVTPELRAGGAEHQWQLLISRLRDRSVDARVLCLGSEGPVATSLSRKGVPIEILNIGKYRELPRVVSAPMVRTFRPDVVISRPVSAQYVGHLLARRWGVPHVFNEHRSPGFGLAPRQQLLTKVIAPWIDSVIAVTPTQRPQLISLGYRPARITVIPNGVASSCVHHSNAATRSALGIPLDATVAILVANLRPEKRVHDFIAAVRVARKAAPELTGLIIGDGPLRRQLEATAGASSGIVFAGHRSDVPALLAAADIFALSSAHEALPLALLEAMAAGLPCVGTDTGEVRSVVTSSNAGAVVHPGDIAAFARELNRFAKDAHLRARAGRQGRLYVKTHHDAEDMAAAYQNAFEQLSRGRRQAPKRGDD